MKQAILLCLLITAAYIPLACLDYVHTPYSDGAEHGAVLRELIRDIVSPGEPMLADYTGKSPRYVPSLVAMASVARLIPISALTTIKLFAIPFFLLFLAAVIFFTYEYFQDPHQCCWSVACVLFLWGTGWTGANAYMFSALVYTSWYPSLIAFSCALISLAYACRFLRKAGPVSFAGWCIFGAAAFVNHPLTASFLWIASVLLTIEIKGWRGLLRPWFIIVFSISIAIMAAWPYYNFFSNLFTITSGSMDASWDYLLTRTYLYSGIILRAGPALAAIAVLPFYLIKQKHSMLSGFLLISLCIYTLGYFLHITLAERFIFAIMFSSQILISRLACVMWQKVRQRTASGTQTVCFYLFIILFASGVIGQMYLIKQEYINPGITICPNAPYIQYEDPTATHKQCARYLQPGDIVFSDMFTSWGIPLYTGAKIVSLFHTPPHVPDNNERKAVVESFYDPSLSNLQRLQILRDFNATKLVVHYPVAGQKIKKQITAMGLPLLLETDTLSIFDIPTVHDDPVPSDAYQERPNRAPSNKQH